MDDTNIGKFKNKEFAYHSIFFILKIKNTPNSGIKVERNIIVHADRNLNPGYDVRDHDVIPTESDAKREAFVESKSTIKDWNGIEIGKGWCIIRNVIDIQFEYQVQSQNDNHANGMLLKGYDLFYQAFTECAKVCFSPNNCMEWLVPFRLIIANNDDAKRIMAYNRHIFEIKYSWFGLVGL